MKKNILLSIITPTLNNHKDLRNFLTSIKKQNFPKSQLEVIIADGGSTDDTLLIAKEFGVKILHNKDKFADAGVNLGMKHAVGEIYMVLAADNIYKSSNALQKIVDVFKDPNIVGAFPRHAYMKTDTIYTKYINTFTDPANHFVYGYACNPRTFERVYTVLKKTQDYTIYDYTSSKIIPLIAFAQGFTVRSSFKRNKVNSFDDIAPVMEIIKSRKKIAYMHSVDLYHHTVSGFYNFVNKQAWKTRNYLYKKNFGISHRIKLLSEQQTKRIYYWPYYSLTIIPPFLFALYHLVKDREKMWILHPFMCIISGYSSFFVYISYKIKK